MVPRNSCPALVTLSGASDEGKAILAAMRRMDPLTQIPAGEVFVCNKFYAVHLNGVTYSSHERRGRSTTWAFVSGLGSPADACVDGARLVEVQYYLNVSLSLGGFVQVAVVKLAKLVDKPQRRGAASRWRLVFDLAVIPVSDFRFHAVVFHPDANKQHVLAVGLS